MMIYVVLPPKQCNQNDFHCVSDVPYIDVLRKLRKCYGTKTLYIESVVS